MQLKLLGHSWHAMTRFPFYSSGSSPEDDSPPIPVCQNFMVPKKEISMFPDMGKWKRSQVCHTYDRFRNEPIYSPEGLDTHYMEMEKLQGPVH